MSNRMNVLLEKRVAKLEEEVNNDPLVIDTELNNELVDTISAMIREFESKFKQQLGDANADKLLRKTKSFKTIKALKEVWIKAASR